MTDYGREARFGYFLIPNAAGPHVAGYHGPTLGAALAAAIKER
ncbi:MAG TPA: hypothetical protein VFA45_15430 [Actinomycetes bacterium]|jgi:hypothetical protein|nr:hypothetical protein [Actinomycetes bacterium]